MLKRTDLRKNDINVLIRKINELNSLRECLNSTYKKKVVNKKIKDYKKEVEKLKRIKTISWQSNK